MADQHPACLGSGSQDLVVPKTGEACIEGGTEVDTWLFAGQCQDDRQVEVRIRLEADAHGWRCRASASFW